MNIRFLIVPAFTALLLSGCGQKDATSGAPAGNAAAAAPAPAAPASAAAREIDLTANDQMQFVYGDQHTSLGSSLQIEAKPGEMLKVVLTNAGTLPKEAMGHNWMLLKAGSDAATFSAAAAAAKDTDYVPPALKDQIYADAAGNLAHIATLDPKRSGETTFKAPDQPGEYPFLCSFPAHYAVGMKGVLVVK